VPYRLLSVVYFVGICVVAGLATVSAPRAAFADAAFAVLDQEVTRIPLLHSSFNVFGFRFGDLAYCTDVSEIPDASWPLLNGVRILIIDALRYKSHPAHFGLNDALDVIERVNPDRAYLTHMSHEFDYETLSASLPGGVEMAYDGLRFRF